MFSYLKSLISLTYLNWSPQGPSEPRCSLASSMFNQGDHLQHFFCLSILKIPLRSQASLHWTLFRKYCTSSRILQGQIYLVQIFLFDVSGIGDALSQGRCVSDTENFRSASLARHWSFFLRDPLIALRILSTQQMLRSNLRQKGVGD